MIDVFKEKLPEQERGFTWVDVTDPSSEELTGIAREYNLSESAVNDCMEPEQLPKIEQLEDHKLFIIFRVYDKTRKKKADDIQEVSRRIAVFYDESLLITIHRTIQPLITLVQETYLGKCRHAHDALLRVVYEVLKTYEAPAVILSQELDQYESAIFLKRKTPNLLKGIYLIKRQGATCNRIISLTDDVVRKLADAHKKHYLSQDILDLQLRLRIFYSDIVEEANHLLNMNVSLASQRTSEIMRILTIISVFFMPLTFIVGIYGMNFRFMPELDWRYGYLAAWITMIITTLLIYVWFRRRKWM